VIERSLDANPAPAGDTGGVDLADLSRRPFQTANQPWTNTSPRPDPYAQGVL
jgi:hypothetical protein